MMTIALAGLLISLAAASGPGSRLPAGEPERPIGADSGALTRAQVVAALSAATDQKPGNFAGHDLSGLDLSGLDFHKANLSHCHLVRTKFTNAKMFAANLDSAIAREADFSNAVLDIALMRGTDASHANFKGASLYAVIVYGANFTDADFTGARLIVAGAGATFVRAKMAHVNAGADPGNQPMGLMRADFTGADLTGADLADANFKKVKLTRANLTGADLTNTDLTLAELDGTVLRSIKGRATIRGLDKAKHVEDAVFDSTPAAKP
jgi:uncharacterized protein YjbI with pentapeptide repeats